MILKFEIDRKWLAYCLQQQGLLLSRKITPHLRGGYYVESFAADAMTIIKDGMVEAEVLIRNHGEIVSGLEDLLWAPRFVEIELPDHVCRKELAPDNADPFSEAELRKLPVSKLIEFVQQYNKCLQELNGRIKPFLLPEEA